MIIHLRKSTLFTQSPEKRFAKEYKVEEKLWSECWFRYKVKHYSIDDLRDYIFAKTGNRPSYDAIYHWIIKTKIYSRAKEAFKIDASVVVSKYFGENEQYVVNVLTKGMKAGTTTSSRSIV